MNKKLLLLFPLIALGVSSCVKYNGKDPAKEKAKTSETSTSEDSSSSSSSEDTSSGNTSSSDSSSSEQGGGEEGPTFGEEVTTYLVLGEYGLFRGEKGTNVPDKYLENTVAYKAKIGSPLPTKTDITTTVSGSSFVCWQAYENAGAPKEYTVVPAHEGTILYAKFSGGSGGGGSGGGGGGGDSLPTTGFGFMFTDSTYLVGTLQDEKDAQGRIQYKISDHQFHTGDTFQLYDFENRAGWVEDLDPYSFANTSGSGNFWPHYINKGSYYTVLVDFTAEIYLKMAYEDNVVYFGLKSTPLDIEDEGGGVTPTPGGTDFGIQMNDTAQTFYSGVKQGEADAQGREQYKIANLELHTGDEFRIYDNTNHAGWVETLDAYSFGGDPEHGHGEVWRTYLDMGTSYYTALQDMTVDVYLKLKWEDNLVYFGLASGGGTDPVDPPATNSYGLNFNGGSKVAATQGEEYDGFDQWVIEDQAFTAGQEFQIWNYATSAGWVVDIDTASFGGAVSTYLTKGESWYTVVADFTADIYIKLKYEQDQIYFGLEGGVTPPADTGYGLNFNGGDKVHATEGEEYDGFAQWVIQDQEFTTGQEFQIYDFSSTNGWVVNIDAASFGSDVASYLTKGETWYTVLQDFTADVYIKLKYGQDQIYFGLESGSVTPPDPVDPEDAITIYFAGVSGWSTISAVNVKVGENAWAAMSATTDDPNGQYVYSITAATNATSLNFFFTQNGGSEYRHPTPGSIDWEATNYSDIDIGEVQLQPGHTYAITWTSWHYNYDNWEHAWFNYTFAEVEVQALP